MLALTAFWYKGYSQKAPFEITYYEQNSFKVKADTITKEEFFENGKPIPVVLVSTKENWEEMTRESLKQTVFIKSL
jgi:hypothetical protein